MSREVARSTAHGGSVNCVTAAIHGGQPEGADEADAPQKTMERGRRRPAPFRLSARVGEDEGLMEEQCERLDVVEPGTSVWRCFRDFFAASPEVTILYAVRREVIAPGALNTRSGPLELFADPDQTEQRNRAATPIEVMTARDWRVRPRGCPIVASSYGWSV